MATSTARKKQPVIDARTFIDAVEEGRTEKVKLLVSAGVDVNAAKDHGMTALMCAASKGHLPIVRILLEQGANVNATREDGFTALMMAAFNGHFDVVRVLLDRGANVHATTRTGTTAQGWASSRGFPEVAQLLKDAEPAGLESAPADQTVKGDLLPTKVSEPSSLESKSTKTGRGATKPEALAQDGSEGRIIAPGGTDESLLYQSPNAKLEDASSRAEGRAQDSPHTRLTIPIGPNETPQFGSLSTKYTEADIRRMTVRPLSGREPRAYQLSSLLPKGNTWRLVAFTLAITLASGMITYLITRRITRPAAAPRNAPLAKDSSSQPAQPVKPVQPPAPPSSERNEEIITDSKVKLSAPVEAPATNSQTAAAPRSKARYNAPPVATISIRPDEVTREDKLASQPKVTIRQRPSPPRPEVLSSTEKEIQPRKVTPPPVVQPQEAQSYEAPSLIVESPKHSQAPPKKKVINWP